MNKSADPRTLRQRIELTVTGVERVLGLSFLDLLSSVLLALAVSELLPGLRRWVPLFLLALVFFVIGLAAVVYVAYRRGGWGWWTGHGGGRFLLWWTIAVVSFIALYYNEERWRGRWAYAALQREVAAHGEKLGLAGLIPPTIPPVQNLALAPIWTSNQFQNVGLSRRDMGGAAPAKAKFSSSNWQPGWLWQEPTDLAAWQRYFRAPYVAYRRNPKTRRTVAVPEKPDFPVAPRAQTPAADVLLALSRYDAFFKQLRAATQVRPKCRFPIDYERDEFADDDAFSPWRPLPDICLVLRLRASAELAAGKSAEALQDFEMMLRLADSVRRVPFLSPQWIRLEMLADALQPVWEGLANHRWSKSELTVIASCLAREDLLANGAFALKAFTAEATAAFARLAGPARSKEPPSGDLGERVQDFAIRHLFPTGWLYLDQVGLNRLYQAKERSAINVPQRRVYPDRTQLRHSVVASYLDPVMDGLIGGGVARVFQTSVREFAFYQTAVDEAKVACALERYRQAHGHFPNELAALAPRWLTSLPCDVITGQPLKYRRTGNDRFVLYSVGWNQRDDGGKPSPRTTGPSAPWPGCSLDLDIGDWVWSYPTHAH